jgi:hypothetical protein
MMNTYRDAIGDNDVTIEEVKERAAYVLSLINPKSAWSEEDENAMRFLKDIVNHSNIYTTPLKEKLYDWLKSIKDRVQPKQEWNKEDEDILNTIINYFEIDLECTENDDIIRWLKSLRPQNKWKPSDEQIYWLKWAIGGMQDTEKANEAEAVLKELLEELEKLL